MPPLIHTRGIALHHVKYGETSIVARIYTERFGLQSYMIKGVRNRKARIPYTLFQAGSLLDMVVYRNEKNTLQHLKDVRCEHVYATALQDVRKISILLFITDILSKTIREEEHNQGLFDFIYQSLVRLDLTAGPVANFHLVFLAHLARFLGFEPRNNYSDHLRYFNMNEGEFYAGKQNPGLYMEPPLTEIFSGLLRSGFETMGALQLSSSERNELLGKILEYYGVHLPLARDIKSHLILREVFG
ncbi:MAG: DNA repair protein RecO [Bacteroidales bacterium]|nr:DNA repair protein RecO [Bacteroidales bacterium]